jgi:hypothetical protein
MDASTNRRLLTHGHNRRGKAQSETEQFIAALLSYPTVEAAAKAVGVGNVTAWRWRKDPAFAERYGEETSRYRVLTWIER